jgi:hypothetical protein
MGSGAKKRREHEEDFIAFPSDSPSPTSSPSPSHRRERNISHVSLERNRKKLLRKMVSDDVQKLMGEFGSAEANPPKRNPRTQMFDLKENDTPTAECTNQVPQKDKKKNGREKRGQEEILEPSKQEPVLSIQELYDLMMSSPEGNIETKEERKKRRADKKAATMRTLFEKKFSPLVAMFPEDEKLVAAAKKSMLEDISRPPPEGVELDIRGDFWGYFPTEDTVVDKREKKKRKREAKKPAQEQDLSKLEEMSQREADEAVVEAPKKKKKKKRKMNHNSSEERPHQSSAMSVYSSNPHKLREKKSTVTDLVGNGSEDLQASPTFLIPTSFLTKGFAKQQALLGTILKSCNFKSPNAPKSTYDNVDMTANYNHHESAILPRKLSITSSSTDDCPPTTVKKPGHVATRTPITPLKSTKPKPSRTKTRPAPLTDDSDSEVDSPVVVTQANQPTGDNGIEWEQSFSKVVASLKKTSVSKIKALFNEDSETSGEGESLSKVVNSIKLHQWTRSAPSFLPDEQQRMEQAREE